MYKIATIAALLLGLALAPVLGSMGFEPESVRSLSNQVTASDAAQPDASEPEPVSEPASPTSVDATCEWSCRACNEGEGCRQLCTEIGDCGNSCGITARCDDQHRWDESACACI